MAPRSTWRLRAQRKALGAQKKRKSGKLGSFLRGLAALALSFYLLWTALFPRQSGAVGLAVHGWLLKFLGYSFYTALAGLFALQWKLYASKIRRPPWRSLTLVCSLLALASSALLFSLAGSLAAPGAAGSFGGLLGERLAQALTRALGGAGALAVGAGTLLASLYVLYGFSSLMVLSAFLEALRGDIRDWKKSRSEAAQKLREMDAANVSAKPIPLAPLPSEAQAPPEPAPERPQEPARAAKEEPPPPSAEKRAAAKAAPESGGFKLPPLTLLNLPPSEEGRGGRPQADELERTSRSLEKTLADFGISAAVTGVTPGPVITRYELTPAPGVKVSSIVARESDIALALKARGIRLIAPIPGKGAIGIEIPNPKPALVTLRIVLESPVFKASPGLTTFALGLSADGEVRVAELSRMPHLLVAGSTNSGKSVLLHSLILSMLARAKPTELKFLMIDPKRLELTFYNGIPHLFDPTSAPQQAGVVTQAKAARQALETMVRFMESRYEKFERYGVRNIESYNAEADKRGEPREFYVVVVIDELADLMIVSRDAVEGAIQRLAQMARAVGIHLVLATQRPSVDVITGVIKANLPCRIALQVISKIDSKVILDGSGAESLQGKGDMLYLAPGAPKAERCQGAYVTEDEIRRVASYLTAQAGPAYEPWEPESSPLESDLAGMGVAPDEFARALKLIVERRRVSQDLLKSQFGSSARATNILSLLEVKGFIQKPEGSNRWDIRFDLVEDFLRKNFSQAPAESAGLSS